MRWRSLAIKPIAAWLYKKQSSWARRPIECQKNQLDSLLSVAKNTVFGQDHDFAGVSSYKDFKERVPIRDYEELSPYVEKIIRGQKDVLWKGHPLYFAKTSGTTSGAKYIPITRASIPNHINSARNAMFSYIHRTGNAHLVDGNMIFLSGSPEMDGQGIIPTGRLSGIVNHHVPYFFRMNQLPSYPTNCIEDWEEKLEAIIKETLNRNMTLISGIPPWVQMYFDRLIENTGKPIKDIFPNFSLLIHGGVNFEPYKSRLFQSMGKEIDSIETYPASEGFVAYQDGHMDQGLLLNVNSGIFFEFVPTDEFFDQNPTRISLEDVELNVSYAIVINSNAGLWGYSLGDTVKFLSLDPYRLLVTGRLKHFISAFGEHVIVEEVEKAIQFALHKHRAELIEFTVAPQVNPQQGLPLHEWYVEFSQPPANLQAFEKDINLHLQELNSYYDDLISGKILKTLEVVSLQKDAFRNYMKSIGKLGGQNKVPRLCNDRTLADELLPYRT